MATKSQLLDRWGNPVNRKALAEAPAQTIGSVRSPISGYPADGLNPVRLAQILRAADHGQPVEYLELAETVEERDPHYLGVIGTRKRAVSQIEISVEAATDMAADVAKADMIRDWLKRDELQEELFGILDAVGKGYSFTRIHWDTSERQYMPARLERRDPRHFRFDRRDLMTPRMLDSKCAEVPLDPFCYIFATIAAKSGLHLRSGLARVAAWGWMFKAFTTRDWAIFTQTYGQPLRLGKWAPGASEQEKDILFRAVANIAGDCAAIIPAGMEIQFVESATVGASSDLYERRADWLDRQISKAVLGQTATTDAIAGGHAVGQEHREVQRDIERADAKALAGILNRDLIRPWIDLEFGPQEHYPRLRIERPETEDLAGLASALEKLVPLGLEVEQSEIRDKFKLSEPAKDAKILRPILTVAPANDDAGVGQHREGAIERFSLKIKRGPAAPGIEPAENTSRHSTGLPEASAQIDDLTADLARAAEPAIAGMLAQIEAMLAAAGSLEEFSEMLQAAWPDLDAGPLTDALVKGMMAAHIAGREDTEAASG